jgi:hypothetical protein
LFVEKESLAMGIRDPERAPELAARASFDSSEVEEKRQLLNFVFQNLKLDGKNLSIQTCEP